MCIKPQDYAKDAWWRTAWRHLQACPHFQVVVHCLVGFPESHVYHGSGDSGIAKIQGSVESAGVVTLADPVSLVDKMSSGSYSVILIY